MTQDTKHVLLFGGGEVHDFRAICALLRRCLETEADLRIDEATEDYDAFLAERLAPYDLVVVYHTGGALTPAQASGLTQWVAAGHGFVGVHSAADSFRTNPEYVAMLGGEFKGHPPVRRYLVSLVDPVPEGIENHITHPITAALTGYTKEQWEQWPIFEYEVEDEQYLLDFDPRVNLLAQTIFRGRQRPVAWTKGWGEGRVFYLALGHDPAACENPFFEKLFLQGARWAGGLI